MSDVPGQTVIPAGSNLVKMKAQRTFATTVTAIIAGGYKEADQRCKFRVDYRVLSKDAVKKIQEEEDDYAFLDAIVYKAFIELTDEQDNPLPESEQRSWLFNDPAFSTAIIHKYFDETAGKNARKKS